MDVWRAISAYDSTYFDRNSVGDVKELKNEARALQENLDTTLARHELLEGLVRIAQPVKLYGILVWR